MSALSVILTPFAKLILLFYSITGSYGVSLLLFALVIRLILFPVFLKGRKSMLSMSGLAEKQQELAKKYARNREKYSQELAKLYEAVSYTHLITTPNMAWPGMEKMARTTAVEKPEVRTYITFSTAAKPRETNTP